MMAAGVSSTTVFQRRSPVTASTPKIRAPEKVGLCSPPSPITSSPFQYAGLDRDTSPVTPV